MSGATDGDLEDVVHRERALLDPTLRADGERVRALLHPEFEEFGASGRAWDRERIVAALVADPGVPGTATDFSAVHLAEDVVLLTYRVEGDSGGSLRSSIWLRDESHGWRLRFHQGTRSSPGR